MQYKTWQELKTLCTAEDITVTVKMYCNKVLIITSADIYIYFDDYADLDSRSRTITNMYHRMEEHINSPPSDLSDPQCSNN